MDAQTGIGENLSSHLREEIERTQLQLGAKLGALEGEVRAVTSQAKEALRERMETARDVFDVRRQVARHPVAWSAIALGIGVMVARRIQQPVPRARAPQASRPGFVRNLAAPHIATLQTVLIGRAIAFVGERLKERMAGSLSGSQARPVNE